MPTPAERTAANLRIASGGAPKRQHWKQHACMLQTNNVEGEPQNSSTAISVYSAKNEGAAPYVLLTSRAVGFDFDAKITRDTARELAAALVAGADAIDAITNVQGVAS